VTQRVLFVDDDEMILKTLQCLFGRRLSLSIALGPEQGLALLDGGERYAVAVVDMAMPVMDGMQFIALAKARDPHLQCVVLSGTVNLRDQVAPESRSLVYEFLEKPCPSARLLAVIKRAQEQHLLATAAVA